jgi:hypothetical protein
MPVLLGTTGAGCVWTLPKTGRARVEGGFFLGMAVWLNSFFIYKELLARGSWHQKGGACCSIQTS